MVKSGLLLEYNALNIITAVVTLTAGSTVIMWIGERITENGVGNGISIVLTINIISRIPQDLTLLFEQFVKGKEIAFQVLNLAIIIAIIIAVTVLTVTLQGAERRIPVQYSRKVQGRKTDWRTVLLYSFKSEYSWCYPDYLRSVLIHVPIDYHAAAW